MSRLVSQPTAAPTRKVTATALGGAFATLTAWALQTYGGVDVPPGIEAALAVVFAVLMGYIVREEDTPGDSRT